VGMVSWLYVASVDPQNYMEEEAIDCGIDGFGSLYSLWTKSWLRGKNKLFGMNIQRCRFPCKPTAGNI
jgi:hypothetical protein